LGVPWLRAGANAINMYVDATFDALMKRTPTVPL